MSVRNNSVECSVHNIWECDAVTKRTNWRTIREVVWFARYISKGGRIRTSIRMPHLDSRIERANIGKARILLGRDGTGGYSRNRYRRQAPRIMTTSNSSINVIPFLLCICFSLNLNNLVDLKAQKLVFN